MFHLLLMCFILGGMMLATGYAEPLDEEVIAAVLDAHNDYRKNEGASNMNKLVWNETLAGTASAWAEACSYSHSVVKGTGQNLALSTSNATHVLHHVDAWFNEKSHYHYEQRACSVGAVCGHYTQVTWAKTSAVGCGVATCGKVENKGTYKQAQIFVCDYYPGGNIGSAVPYDEGEACTKCAQPFNWCDANTGLCTSKTDGNCTGTDVCECRLVCNNGGTLDTETCSCVCPDGYYGDFCEKKCKKASWCNGLYSLFCSPGNKYYTYVTSNCPYLCNLCVLV
jgi:hypothetical protein